MMISIATLDQNDQLWMIIGIEWDRMGSGPDQDRSSMVSVFLGFHFRVANDYNPIMAWNFAWAYIGKNCHLKIRCDVRPKEEQLHISTLID